MVIKITKKLKILNLFAGIGGNRVLWDGYDITAIESNSILAYVYHKHFPSDNVIVTDAYEYFKKNFWKYDILWASPECQSHTRMVRFSVHKCYQGIPTKVELPDMRMWGLIFFLMEHFRGEWIVENVKSYYKPPEKPTSVIRRHWIWSSKKIPPMKKKKSLDQFPYKYKTKNGIKKMLSKKELPHDLDDISVDLAYKAVNNALCPDEGKWILDYLLGKERHNTMF